MQLVADHSADVFEEPVDPVDPGYGEHFHKSSDQSGEGSSMTVHQGEDVHAPLGGHGQAAQQHGRTGAR